MFSRFFIDRPIFASVLSIVITLAGAISLRTLPVAQYPEITPPTVEVSAYYPGANAQVVADTVAAPIEQQVNGVENMMYMSSQCTNDGNYTLTVTFKHVVDLDMAQVLVQNRESLAEPILPDLVKRRGVAVKKKSPSILMIINVFSPDKSRDNLYLSNYATIQLRDELARLDGVGDITYIGQRNYSMRIWLDPQKMSFRNLTSSDVVSAVSQQNIQVAAGQLGQPPVPNGQAFQFTITTLGRLTEPEQFAEMILKTDAQGGVVRLRDVGRVELGAREYDQACTLDGRPTVALSVYQRPGSNALETAALVQEKMSELKERFPDGVDYAIAYDTTPFIVESVNEVFHTLRDAVILVAFVVLLFLQNWRSALIPLVAVPVAVVGTFAVMAALGFSLNNLTLFGLVLAIGIVVDDAIVVVEAVEHHIELGLNPREATVTAMSQVSAPVIAVGLVLTAVFIPCAFISGITGQFYRQFALTIATSTVISAFNSLTLSPALSALLLRPRQKGVFQALPWPAFAAAGAWFGYSMLGPKLLGLAAANGLHWHGPMLTPGQTAGLVGLAAGGLAGWIVSGLLNRICGWSFYLFNQAFDAATNVYTRIVAGVLRISVLVLLLYGGLLGLTYWGLARTPTGFIPSQDKGYLLANIQLPDSSSLERTQKVMEQVEAITGKVPGVAHTLAIAGQSILMNANAPNFGAMYVMLDEFHRRAEHGLTGPVIAARLQAALQTEIKEGLINIFDAPPVDGLGTAGGFKVVIEDRGDLGPQELEQVANRIVAKSSDPALPYVNLLQGLFTSFRANTPWLYLDIDRDKAKLAGVSIAEAVQHSSGLPGLTLRQRFQSVRPDLAGQRAGRRQLPQADRRPDRTAGAERARRDGAAGQHRRSPRRERSGDEPPVQPLSGGHDQPQHRPGGQFRPGDRRHGETGSGGAAPGHADPMDRAGAVAARDRLDRHVRLHPGGRACVPGAGGAVRELVAAPGRHSRRADVLAVLDRRCEHRRDGHQHLHPGRVHRPGWPGVQERDLDRRIREGAARQRLDARERHPRSLPASIAADHDDLAGLHPGRGSAHGVCKARAPRCGRRWASRSSAECSGSPCSGSS